MLLRTQDEITARWPKDAEPLVCIRCTAFNQEKFIAQCLEGFLIQETDFPFEVIAHDDASSDRTGEIIREYAAKYPKIIKPYIETENQWSKNDGSFTRVMDSLTIRKYVGMCEGDDYWIDPHKLQTQIDFLESHPDYTMTFHDAEIKNEPGVEPVDSVYPPMEDREYTATELFEKWIVPTASMVYLRKIRDYPIKNPLNIMNGDIFLVEKCAHTGKVRCFNKKMSVYRRQPGGVTWDQSKQIQRLKEYPAHLMELKLNFPKINHRLISRAICGTFVNAWDYVNLKTKIYYFFKGISLAPRTFLRNLYRKKISHKK